MTAACAPPLLTSIEVLERSLFHGARAARTFMVMTGYFDESGTHSNGSPAVIVGGFIASSEQWSAFERELSELMREYGVTVFHAKDLRQRKGGFKNWPPNKCATFNSRFLRLADDHLACGISIVLRTADYANVYRAVDFPRRSRPDTLYGMCLRAAIMKALLFIGDRRSDWPLNIIMEDGNRNIGDALKVFVEFKKGLFLRYAGALGFFSVGSKKDCLPLAMSDALAYAVFRMSAGLSRHPTNPNVAAVVGAADPPYYVSKVPLSRTIIDIPTLARWRDELLGVVVPDFPRLLL